MANTNLISALVRGIMSAKDKTLDDAFTSQTREDRLWDMLEHPRQSRRMCKEDILAAKARNPWFDIPDQRNELEEMLIDVQVENCLNAIDKYRRRGRRPGYPMATWDKWETI